MFQGEGPRAQARQCDAQAGCFTAAGTPLDQGSNPCPLPWRAVISTATRQVPRGGAAPRAPTVAGAPGFLFLRVGGGLTGIGLAGSPWTPSSTIHAQGELTSSAVVVQSLSRVCLFREGRGTSPHCPRRLPTLISTLLRPYP